MFRARFAYHSANANRAALADLLDWAEQEDRQRVDQDQEIRELSQRVQELDEKWTQEFLDRRK